MLARNIGSVSRPFAKGVAALGLLAASASSSALEYSLKELPTLAGYENVYVSGLNDGGQVVGFGYNGMALGTAPIALSQIEGGLAFVTGAQGSGITAIQAQDGYAWSRATGINNAGQVIGNAGNGMPYDGLTQAFLVQAGSSQAAAIPGLNGQTSVARAINASGQVVGEYRDSGGSRPYLSSADGSSVQTLALPQFYTVISATGVTDDGRVVGAHGEGRYQSAFITGPQGDAPQTMIFPNSISLFPTGINDAGQIVGHRNDSASGVLFLEPDGTVRTLDFSNAPAYVPGNAGGYGQYGPLTSVIPEALNASGLVGGAIVSNGFADLGASHAFITGPGGTDVTQVDMLSFVNQSGPLDFYFTSVTGINSLGSFVANASNGHAYLISVVPEPATYVTMLAGLAMLGVAVRRHKRAKKA